MAKFTKKIEFTAFQFVPEELANVSPYDLDDVLSEVFEDASFNSVDLIDGKLFASIYTFSSDGNKETFVLNPGDWLIEDGAFWVLEDEAFKEMGTPVESD